MSYYYYHELRLSRFSRCRLIVFELFAPPNAPPKTIGVPLLTPNALPTWIVALPNTSLAWWTIAPLRHRLRCHMLRLLGRLLRHGLRCHRHSMDLRRRQ